MLDHLHQATDDLHLSAEQLRQLVAHWDLVIRWNRKINLTAITDPRRAAYLHYRDSLEALPFVKGPEVADIGSGAGYPGIPLAVALPEVRFTLVEPRRKRASFLRTVIAELGLKNTGVFCGRSTDTPPRLFSTLTSRATFSDPKDLAALTPWLSDDGIVIAFRNAPLADYTPQDAHEYAVDGEARALYLFCRASFSDAP